MSTINDKLESLVGRRFSQEDLDEELSYLFGCEVNTEVCDMGKDYDELDDVLDNHLLFEINGAWNIDVDLFYLVDNAKNWYITETNFEQQ